MDPAQIVKVLALLVQMGACHPAIFNTGAKQLVIVVCPFTQAAPGEDAQKAPDPQAPPVQKQVWHG